MFVRSDGAQLRRVGEVVERHGLRPILDPHEFRLDDVREALCLVSDGHPQGMVVIRP